MEILNLRRTLPEVYRFLLHICDEHIYKVRSPLVRSTLYTVCQYESISGINFYQSKIKNGLEYILSASVNF